MSFFIPGRTTCAICEQPIDARFHAGQVPYADPADVGALATMGRRFVHRSCWEAWSERDRYVRSAVSVRARHPQPDGHPAAVDLATSIVWHGSSATRRYSVEDLRSLVTLSFPQGDACRLAAWLWDGVAAGAGPDLTMEHEIWRLERDGADVTFRRSQAAEPIEVTCISQERLKAWAMLIQTLCGRAA